MNYTKLSTVLLTLCFITTFAAAQTAGNLTEEDFELEVEETELEDGDNLEARIDTPDINDSLVEYRFTYADEDVQPEEPIYETEVETGREHLQGIVRSDGDMLFSDAERIEVSPEADVELEISPDDIEPGDTVEARVEVDTDADSDSLEYRWIDNSMTREDIHERDQPEISFETNERVTDDPSLEVRIWDEDSRTDIGVIEREIDWYIPDVDADGLEVEYGDQAIEVEVSEEELDDRPSFRAGTSIDAWDEIDLRAFDVIGGVEFDLEEQNTEDYEDDNDLIPYSVVEIDGENIEDLSLTIESDVEKDWLNNNELLISSREADISYYMIENGDWEKLGSDFRSGSDGHIGVRSDRRDRDDWQLGTNNAEIAIAGDPSGIDHGNFALNSDGMCEELDDGEPLPGGWQELEVTCQTLNEVERTEDQLDRITRRADEVDIEEEVETIEAYLAQDLPGPATLEIEELERTIEARDARNNVEQVREQLNQTRINDTDTFLEDLEEVEEAIESFEDGDIDRREFREERRELGQISQRLSEAERSAEIDARGGRAQALPGGADPDDTFIERELENRLEQMSGRALDNLPEEANITYERPEEVQERVDDLKDQVEEEDVDPEELIGEVRELQDFKSETEEYQRLQSASNTWRSIERYEDHERLDEELEADLNESRELLLAGEIEEAEELMEGVERSIEVSEAREFIMDLLQDEEVRQLVRDVVSEVIPGL